MNRFGLSLISCLGLLVEFGPQRARAEALETPPTFTPRASLPLRELMQLVAEHDPALQKDLLAVALSRAQLHQSKLLDNPVLDGAVGTIPVGTANPPDLPSPLANIPNYGVGLSMHLDLARRGPKITQAGALVGAAHAQLDASVRERALGLAHVLGGLAVTALRIEAKRGLIDQARGALAIAQSRVESGYSAPVEASRVEIDELRLQEQLLAQEGELKASLASCAEFLGMRCAPFASTSEARGFLSHFTSDAAAQGEPSLSALAERPDLQALASQHAAAEAERQLSRAQSVPDPTLRLGYLYDTFVASGNQRHSVSVAMSMPLPIIDHGQAAAQAAQARMHHLETERQRRILAASAHIEALRAALLVQRQRHQVLQEKMLPRARAILDDVRRAFELRSLRLTELILARNTLDELLLAEADTLSDAFNTALELLSQLPVVPGADGPAPGAATR